MTYNIISTEEMDSLLDNCVGYLLNKFKSKQADKDILASDEDVRSISQKLMAQNKEAYEVLAK